MLLHTSCIVQCLFSGASTAGEGAVVDLVSGSESSDDPEPSPVSRDPPTTVGQDGAVAKVEAKPVEQRAPTAAATEVRVQHT